eukprot:555122_1
MEINSDSDSDLDSDLDSDEHLIEYSNIQEIENGFALSILQLGKGDKIDVYDEEMGWWEVATIQNDICPGTTQIQFTFNDEEKVDGCDSKYLWKINVSEIDVAPFMTHTLPCINLNMLSGYYVVNDEINTYFDDENNENIILGLKPMSSDDKIPYLLSDIPTTRKMIYNIKQNEDFE